MRKKATVGNKVKAQVALEAARGVRTTGEIARRFEVHPIQVGKWRSKLLERAHEVFEEGGVVSAASHEREIAELYEQIGRLKVENDFLKKNLTSEISDRRSLIEPEYELLSIADQCRLLEVSRSSFYYEPCQESPLNLLLMRKLDRLSTDHPFAGSRMLCDILCQDGYAVNRKRIARLMRLMGIEAIYPRKSLSKRHPDHQVYPYLLRHVPIIRPNQVWSIDITYIALRPGFIYLVAVLDWFSRFVLSWDISNSLANDFCVAAVQAALRKYGLPEIFNSDQGTQFTASNFLQPLLDREIRISMDGRGRALDNVFIERLWRTVKYEEVLLREYADGQDAFFNLKNYFRFYNHRRPHKALEKMTPAAVYLAAA